MFEVGDRVIFSNEEAPYSRGPSNPLIGTKYFCEGTIVTPKSPDTEWVSVDWDNGSANQYKVDDLELVRRKAPDWKI